MDRTYIDRYSYQSIDWQDRDMFWQFFHIVEWQCYKNIMLGICTSNYVLLYCNNNHLGKAWHIFVWLGWMFHLVCIKLDKWSNRRFGLFVDILVSIRMLMWVNWRLCLDCEDKFQPLRYTIDRLGSIWIQLRIHIDLFVGSIQNVNFTDMFYLARNIFHRSNSLNIQYHKHMIFSNHHNVGDLTSNKLCFLEHMIDHC